MFSPINLLLAQNFVRTGGLRERVQYGNMGIEGFRGYPNRKAGGYSAFLQENSFDILRYKIVPLVFYPDVYGAAKRKPELTLFYPSNFVNSYKHT
ncbi:MAG: hypothetical protein LBD47_04355 [Treponema sp.]|nr:hypothetical protein [Treponema sp.]